MNCVRFTIATGKLSTFDSAGAETVIGSAYAGHPPHVNDPSAVQMVGVGPLPPGWYTIGSAEDRPMSVGVFALPLVPDFANQMFGRSGFYIHGANAEKDATGENSSDGCIVAARPLRTICAAYARLQVI